MSNVLVHKGKPRDYKNYLGSMIILDKIAAAFNSLGYTVYRWMSACEDPFPVEVVFDKAVIWCGQQNWYPPIKEHFKQMGTKILYCDVDVFGEWMDDGEKDYMFQLQYSVPNTPAGGVGTFVCWQDFPMSSPMVADGGTPLKVNTNAEDLLVILQEDISLRVNPCLTPVFTDCMPWVYHLLNYSRLPLLVRKHPMYSVSPIVEQMVASYSNARWSMAATLEDELKNVRAVACIDSHAGSKAVIAGMPVLCYGRAMYRRDGVSYQCNADAHRTAAVTAELAAGRCCISRDRQIEWEAYVRSRMWRISELPDRLEEYLNDEDELKLGYPEKEE